MKEITIQEVVKAVDGRLLGGSETTVISSVSTNSKEILQGALFVPIIGERVDAHRFIADALKQGAVATFTSHAMEKEELQKGKCYIKVTDTQKALQALAAYYRSLFQIPIVGITGSVGKTTTKEMIYAALATKCNVLKTFGNMNSQIGLPLMMFHLEDSYQIAAIEMGMSEVGEMTRLAHIAKPQKAVMTNIGVSHIGQLGSQNNIRKEKMNIINTFTEGNTLFLNGDDELLLEIEAMIKNPEQLSENVVSNETKNALKHTKIITFGIGEHCRYRAKEIVTQGEHTHFTAVTPHGEEKIELSVLGIHNVNNALVALAVAESFGIAPKEAKIGLKAYQPIEKRGQIIEKNGVQWIDDTYNASPDSMKSGVEVLLQMEHLQRRIAILADVLELGEVSKECHYGVGAYIAKLYREGKKIDVVCSVGTEAKQITKALTEEAVDIEAKHFSDNKEVIAYLQNKLKAGDGVLVKGSRGMHTEDIIKAFVEKQ